VKTGSLIAVYGQPVDFAPLSTNEKDSQLAYHLVHCHVAAWPLGSHATRRIVLRQRRHEVGVVQNAEAGSEYVEWPSHAAIRDWGELGACSTQ
jgi:hypothetical protein